MLIVGDKIDGYVVSNRMLIAGTNTWPCHRSQNDRVTDVIK